MRTSLKTDSLDSSARTSLSELEELLTKSASMNQSGLVQKLRALQLVEEMITVQEQRMGINGSGKNCCQIFINPVSLVVFR